MSYVLGGGGLLVNRNTGAFVVPVGPSAGQNVSGGAANAFGNWSAFLDGNAPSVLSVTTYTLSGGSDPQFITLPATIPTGSKLILAVLNSQNAYAITTPSGWNLRDSQNTWSVFSKQGQLFERTAGSADGGTQVTLTTGGVGWNGTAMLYVVTGAASNAFGLSTIANGGPTTTPNATIVNVPGGGTENCLFISLGLDNRDSGGSVTTAPAGYSSLQSAYNATAGIYSAVKTAVASSEDPGNFTLSGNDRWGVWAIAVQPNSFGNGDAIIWAVTLQANINAALDYLQFELGTGGPGAEVTKYKDRIIVRRDTTGDDHWGNPRAEIFPILIPSGERVSLRLADDVGGSLVHVCSLHCLDADDFTILSPT